MTDALKKVRDELGTDAIILSTRTEKKGGVFDFMGQRQVEVTAAVDDNKNDGRSAGRRESRTAVSAIGPRDASLYPPERPVAYEPRGKSAFASRTGSVDVKDIESRVNMEKMLDDIKELKNSIRVLADTALSGDMSGLPPNLSSLLTAMKASGMDEKASKRIVHQLLNELTGVEMADDAVVRQRATDMLLTSMGDVSPIIFAGQKPRMVAFAGPTGSGKTTTIAKLAADFTLNMNKDVSILTIDTKRVDAVGQLKAYCRILNIPLNIAYTPDELPSMMPILMKSDITLIDTPGSGPMDKPQMIEMVEFLQKIIPQEVHLVMSVTTSLAEMKRIDDNFSVLKPNRLLFTKLDETDHYGAMVSFAIAAKKPLSYFTYGQNVPGDFTSADPLRILEQNLGAAVNQRSGQPRFFDVKDRNE